MAPIHQSGESDRAYARRHAAAYAESSPSYRHLADDYAQWYVTRFMGDCGGDSFDGSHLDGLPSHPIVWPQWVATVGAKSGA